MKVAYVVKRYPRYSETFIVNEILAHERAGLEIEIFSLRPPSDERFQDTISQVRAPVTYIGTGGGKSATFWNELHACARLLPDTYSRLPDADGAPAGDVCQAFTLARLASERGIDLMHAHFATVATSVARLASRFSRIPFTFTAHAKDIFHTDVDPADLRHKLDDAAATITVSDFNVAHLLACGAPPEKLVRIYNGLPLERFPYMDPSDRPATVLAVGRLVEKKGFLDLIDAFAELAQRNVDFLGRIIGAGEKEIELGERIARHQLGARVRLEGPRPQREVIDALRSAAVLAAPCIVGEDGNRDGLPTVLPEAMAVGTPCVGTPVTGIPEIVDDGRTGLIVPESDPKALADALERLLSDRELRVRLARSARDRVESDYDVTRSAAEMREVFERGAPAR